MRLPQIRNEPNSLYTRAKAQVYSVQTLGKTLGGYGWLYRDTNIYQQCEDWVEFCQDLGVKLPVFWIDIEPYITNDNLPTIEQIEQAVTILRDQFKVNPGIYTGPWVWSLLRNKISPVLNSCPLWTAEYNNMATLTDVTLYGGWTACVGHQFSSNPVDQNVFDYDYTIAA